MKRPSTTVLALGVILAISGALFAQSRDRRSERGGRSNSNSNSWGTGTGGAMTNPTGPGFTADSPKPGQPLAGKFAILEEKSIFEKDRHIVRAEFNTDSQPHEVKVEPRPPEVRAPGVPVLVGVIIGETELVAYLEDPDSGKLSAVYTGDSLPSAYGVVDKIDLGEIEITKAGEAPKRIVIGQNIAGDTPSTHYSFTPPVASGGSGGSATQPEGSATLPGIDANSPNLTIEQRMKLKRLQQLGN